MIGFKIIVSVVVLVYGCVISAGVYRLKYLGIKLFTLLTKTDSSLKGWWCQNSSKRRADGKNNRGRTGMSDKLGSVITEYFDMLVNIIFSLSGRELDVKINTSLSSVHWIWSYIASNLLAELPLIYYSSLVAPAVFVSLVLGSSELVLLQQTDLLQTSVPGHHFSFSWTCLSTVCCLYSHRCLLLYVPHTHTHSFLLFWFPPLFCCVKIKAEPKASDCVKQSQLSHYSHYSYLTTHIRSCMCTQKETDKQWTSLANCS